MTAQAQVVAGIAKFIELRGIKMDLMKYKQYITAHDEELEEDILDSFENSEFYLAIE